MARPKKTLDSSNVYDLLAKKRDGGELSHSEITQLIRSYSVDMLPDYQMSALLTSIFIHGLSERELASLTDAMLYSGSVLKFKSKNIIDKHSTGGIGDKTSFIVAPIAAACGIKVPMIAGRGLGHTGGTVDKIESLKGFKTTLSLRSFQRQVEKHSLALIGQTKDIAPADKKIYALRDVTATVESIPLIAASIMSKKLAEGANGIVMDVKYGTGAFLCDLKEAKKLAMTLRKIAGRFKKSIITFVSDMNAPLGMAIGNSLEIIESIETLKNKGPKDLTELSLALSGAMIFLGGKAKNLSEGREKAKKALENGSALKKFKELIHLQKGNPKVIDDYSLLPLAKEKTQVYAPRSAYIKSLNSKILGQMLTSLGGGRKVLTDKIDFAPGIFILKKIGDQVKKGEALLTFHHHKKQEKLVEVLRKKVLSQVFLFSKAKVKKSRLIMQTKIQK